MASMDGQVALVTGGARGIGLAISSRLANRGVKVAVGYSHGADTAKAFAAAHEGATIHQGNLPVHTGHTASLPLGDAGYRVTSTISNEYNDAR